MNSVNYNPGAFYHEIEEESSESNNTFFLKNIMNKIKSNVLQNDVEQNNEIINLEPEIVSNIQEEKEKQEMLFPKMEPEIAPKMEPEIAPKMEPEQEETINKGIIFPKNIDVNKTVENTNNYKESPILKRNLENIIVILNNENMEKKKENQKESCLNFSKIILILLVLFFTFTRNNLNFISY